MNALEPDLRVEFDRDLLHMNESGHLADVAAPKIEGLRAFTRAGYRPVAVVDHEPALSRAMVEADGAGDILFLQTRTTSPSPRLTGPRSAAGRHFDLGTLMGENDLPDQVQLIWHGVLEAFAVHVRGLKLGLKDGSGVLDEVLALLERHGSDDDHLRGQRL